MSAHIDIKQALNIIRGCLRQYFLQLLELGDSSALLAASFQNRAARVIAILRLVLAAVFLAALYFDPYQPARVPAFAYFLLCFYFLTSAILLRIAWVSWWHDFRLTTWAYLFDVAVFSLSVWITEGPNREFNSPFLAFFVFLMVSSTLRWNWRVTGVAAFLITAVYLATGGLLVALDLNFALTPFLRRTTYMVVIGLAFVFFGMQRGGPKVVERFEKVSEVDALEAALRYAAGLMAANRVAIIWEEEEEPPVAAVLDQGRFRVLDGLNWLEDVDRSTRLFCAAQKRELVQDPGKKRLSARHCAQPIRLAIAAHINEGLSAGLFSARGLRGQIVVGGMEEISVDEIERVKAVAYAVVELIEGRKLADLERDRAIVQTREALALDLHDSVAQALAGASFGLEALRHSIPADATEALQSVASLKQSLRTEQANIRELIERLRSDPDDDRFVDLSDELNRVLEDCRRHWNIDVSNLSKTALMIATPLAFECKQLVREAVSNAARHARARHVDVIASMDQGLLKLEIRNDGKQFLQQSDRDQPWSISQRIARLNGTVEIESSAGQTRILIELPHGGSTNENYTR